MTTPLSGLSGRSSRQRSRVASVLVWSSMSTRTKAPTSAALRKTGPTVSRQRSRSMSRPIWVSLRLTFRSRPPRGERVERLHVAAGGQPAGVRRVDRFAQHVDRRPVALAAQALERGSTSASVSPAMKRRTIGRVIGIRVESRPSAWWDRAESRREGPLGGHGGSSWAPMVHARSRSACRPPARRGVAAGLGGPACGAAPPPGSAGSSRARSRRSAGRRPELRASASTSSSALRSDVESACSVASAGPTGLLAAMIRGISGAGRGSRKSRKANGTGRTASGDACHRIQPAMTRRTRRTRTSSRWPRSPPGDPGVDPLAGTSAAAPAASPARRRDPDGRGAVAADGEHERGAQAALGAATGPPARRQARSAPGGGSPDVARASRRSGQASRRFSRRSQPWPSSSYQWTSWCLPSISSASTILSVISGTTRRSLRPWRIRSGASIRSAR